MRGSKALLSWIALVIVVMGGGADEPRRPPPVAGAQSVATAEDTAKQRRSTSPAGSFTMEQVAHACALIEGCLVAPLAVGVSLTGCFWRLDQLNARLYVGRDERETLACLAGANDCSSARSCRGSTNVRCKKDGVGRCEGSVAVSCEHGFEYREDCGADGGHCEQTGPGLLAYCVYGSCDASSCVDNEFLECESNQIRHKEGCGPGQCAAHHGCFLDGGGGQCSEDRCHQNRTVACVEGFEHPTLDCTRIGGTCYVEESAIAKCGFPAGQCATDAAGECDDDVATLCARGRWIRFDCRTVGLRCLREANGSRCG
jgi:hypothetical protein